MQMILVQVNRIRAAKKLVLYFRFLETAARQVSECRGQFEHLPESSQSSTLNISFASDQLDIKDVRDFGTRIREYFKLSPTFYTMSANLAFVDPELKKHCEVVKHQKASMKELAEYYLSYMDRQGKEADPKVKDKLAKNQYSDSILPPPAAPMQFGYGYGGPGGYQQMPGFPPNPSAGPNPFGAPQPSYQRPPPGGTPFGGPPGQQSYNPFGPAPGQQSTGYSMNAPQGYQQPPPNAYNYQQPTMPGMPGQYNPFAPPQPQAYAKAAPPHPFGPAPTGNNGNQFDDLFADPSEPKNHGFGGDKKSSTEDDDFLKQLEELKKL